MPTPRYVAERTGPIEWRLSVDGEDYSTHAGYRDAARAASEHDRSRRLRRALIWHVTVFILSGLLLTAVLSWRETDNPNFPAARAFVDRMEEAYRSIEAGAADPGHYTPATDGFGGATTQIEIGGRAIEYVVIAGRHEADCYLMRWEAGRIPFIALLRPDLPCDAARAPVVFAPSDYDAVGVTTGSAENLDWTGVLPDEVVLFRWFFPATFVLLFVVLQQLVSLSIVAIRGVPMRTVPVERIEQADGVASQPVGEGEH
jgi:hypothetical protein